ncbi:MAG: hypothetical protein AAGA93_14915 [Actinomycetota bacterium]
MVDQYGEHASRSQLPGGWTRTGPPSGSGFTRSGGGAWAGVACVVGLLVFVAACNLIAPGGSGEPNAGERWVADLSKRRWTSAGFAPCAGADVAPSDPAVERRIADDFGAGIDYSSIDWSTAPDGSASGIMTIGGAGYLVTVETGPGPNGWQVCGYELEALEEP